MLLLKRKKIGVIVKAMVLGGAIGALGGLISNFSDIQIHNNIPVGQLSVPEHWTFVLHGITWLVVGAGVGLGAGCAGINRFGIENESILRRKSSQ